MEFTFKLTEQEANTILQALQELQAKVAIPIMQKIQNQAQAQMPAANEATATVEEA